MTTYHTGNPLGSVDVKDLYDNAQNFDVAVNGTAPTWDDRLGVTRKSWSSIEGAIDSVVDNANAMIATLGYQVPVPYTAGIELTLASQTVTYNGQTYAPIGDQLPFTTSGTFEDDKFRLIQGVSGADLSSPNGSFMVGFVGEGADSEPRTLQDKSRDTISVKDFGAVGDGITDDTFSIQKGIDFCVEKGAELFFPSGNYYITSTLTLDEGTATEQVEPKCSLVGEAGGTFITAGPGNYTAIRIIGSDVSAGGKHSHQIVRDFTIAKAGAREGVAFHCSDLAYFGMTNVFIRFFGRGMQLEDCLSSHFERIVIRGCMSGVRAERFDNSHPNALTFISCNIAANTVYGAIFVEPTTLNFIGGSIENNGEAGSDQYALTVVSSGSGGAVGAVLSGVYFEDNAGLADIYFLQEINKASCLIQGCTFNRLSSEHHTISNIRARAGVGTVLDLSLIGNGFMGYGSYVANPARPYLDVPESSETFSITGAGNMFGSTVEDPWTEVIYTDGDVRGSRFTSQNGTSGIGFYAIGDGQSSTMRTRRSQTAVGAAEFNMQKSRGTSASPTLLVNNDLIGALSADGWSGSDYTRASAINFIVEGTPTVGVTPTGIAFQISNSAGVLLTAMRISSAGSTNPGGDNLYSLGSPGSRWSVVYAATGAINTSDINEKQQIRSVSESEMRVASKLKGLIRAFKFNESVELKGDGARIHFGVMAQEVKLAFESEGLVAEDYAVLCYDEWDAQEEAIDDNGNIVQEAREAGSRHGIRYEELLAFIISSL